MNPLISVIMPIYNVEKYIDKAIESVLTQTFKDFEFIILDDGSSDNTVKIVKSFKDARIKFFQRPHLGIVQQLNFAINNSIGKFIVRMDGDDISAIDRFEKQYDFLTKNPEVDIVGSNIVLLDEHGASIVKKEYPETHAAIEFQMPVLCAICHPSIMMKKSCFEEIGGYRKYHYSEDYDFFLRMLLHGYRFHNLQDYLLNYRFPNMSLDKTKLSIQTSMILKLGTNYLKNISAVNPNSIHYYRLGLAHYYTGDLNTARNYFIKDLIYNPRNILKISRFLFVSLLGDRNIRSLRDRGILLKFNHKLKKWFNLELQKIYPTK